MKKTRIKSGVQALLLLLIAVFLDVSILNVGNLALWNNPSLNKNIDYTLQDFEVVNWSNENGTLISRTDPILILSDLDYYIETVKIQAVVQPKVPYIDVFYINKEYPQYGEQVIRIDKPEKESIVSIRDEVSALRIDLGDAQGTILTELNVTVNPLKFLFSIPIVVAVVLIYLGGKFLFSLQRAPDYGLAETTAEQVKEQEE